MAFPTRLLIEGEELVMDLRPHWIALIMPAIATLATIAVMLVLYNAFDESILDNVVGIAGALFLLAYPVRKLVDWLTSHFVVTSDRIIGAGTLVVQSASEAGRQVFDHIRKPEEVQKTIYHQGELNQQRMMRGSDGRSTHSSTSELERLADLRARGVLTEEEFQSQKRRILG